MKLRRTLFALAFTMTVVSLPVSARDIKVGIPPDSMPLIGVDKDNLTGVIGEIATIVFARAGHKVAVEVLPFARLHKLVEDGTVDAGARLLASGERRKLAFYSDPIVTEYQAIVVPKGKSFAAQSVDDLKGKSIGVQRGFIYPTLDGKPGITLDPGDSIINNVRKMLGGRLDAVIVNSVFGMYQIREAGLQDQVETLPAAAAAVPLSVALAISKFSDDERNQFNSDLIAVLASPDAERIRSKYGDPALFKAYDLLRQ